MKYISTGEPSTLKTYRNIAQFFCLNNNKPVEFIDMKIKESSNGEAEEVIADERQMLLLFATMGREKFDLDEFIKKHKETYINYFECLLSPAGVLTYARPSHQMALVKIYCTQENITEEQLWDLMDVWESPIHWIIQRTGYMSLWSDGYIAPKELTKEQKKVFRRLLREKLIKNSDWK